MDKLSRIDFTNHKLHIVKNEYFESYQLKVDGTIVNSIKFTLINGVTLITGDFGNWVACRPFNPNTEIIDSVGYFCEKLTINSTQSTTEWCEDTLNENIDNLISILKDKGLRKNELAKCENFLNELKDYGGEETDYYNYFTDNAPNSFEYDWLPSGKKTQYSILIIIDAFNEIGKRIKKHYKLS